MFYDKFKDMKYPVGAITSINELESYTLMPIYFASRHFKCVEEVKFHFTGSLVMCEPIRYIGAEIRSPEVYSKDDLERYEWMVVTSQYGHTHTVSLQDRNIGRMNQYNDWFIFSSKELAQAWAMNQGE